MDTIKFQQWSSFVELSFWFKLAEKKLDDFKLDTRSVPINAYTNVCDFQEPYTLQIKLDSTAFEELQLPKYHCAINGNLKVLNTLEDFKNFNPAEHLDCVKRKIENVMNDESNQIANLLNTFELIVFVDLKKYLYYYWFAFPAIKSIESYVRTQCCPLIKSVWNLEDRMEKLSNLAQNQIKNNSYLFQITLKNDDFEVSEINNWNSDGALVSVIPDNCNVYNWILRNALIYLQLKKRIQKVEIIRLKMRGNSILSNSDVSVVTLPKEDLNFDELLITGWERNTNNRLAPRFLNLRHMGPENLASNIVNLNLKLMKWNSFPNLDLQLIQNTKCLLLGAGTLGCGVARNLIAWGFRNLTFVDNAKVSYSNPTRQFLFTYKDSCKGSHKATTAALRCRKILPSCNATGIDLYVPKIGLPLGEKDMNSIKTLEQLIEDHDVIFLLFDSRESRWIPSLIASAYGKLCISGALGFDSYLVIRHGINYLNFQPISDQNLSLGCYFCNDPNVPSNNLANKTIDQQCTVVRPGLSSLASSMSVELLVSLLHHPLKGGALPYQEKGPKYNSRTNTETLPHQIRGFLSNFNTMCMTNFRSKNCIACSDAVVQSYIMRKENFLTEAFENPLALERISGIEAIKQETHKIFELNFGIDEQN